MRAPHVPQRRTPRRASNLSDFARRPRGGHATMVLSDHSEHRGREPTRGRIGANLADVEGDDRAAGLLDALDYLALHGEGTNETVEVGDHDDVGLTRLDHRDGLAQA